MVNSFSEPALMKAEDPDEMAPTVISDSKSSSHILTQYAGKTLVFPAAWVTDIIVIERRKILQLPFYPAAVLGVVHYQTSVVPLVILERFSASTTGLKPSQSTLMAVRLNEATGSLNGVGVVVDRLLGHADEMTMESGDRFQISDLPAQLWQPLS